MTNSEREALDFLKDFENSTRSFFLHQGMADSDLPSALLEAQWQLLGCILRSKLDSAKRQGNYRSLIRRKGIAKEE